MSIAIAIKTMNRDPAPNYLGQTIANLTRAGVFDSPFFHSLTVVDSGDATDPAYDPEVEAYLTRELWSPLPDSVHGRTRAYLGAANLHRTAATAIRLAAFSTASWVLVLEDDIDVVDDFLTIAHRWLTEHASPVYRMYAFGANYGEIDQAVAAGRTLYRYPIGDFYGAQALAWTREDAQQLANWLGDDPNYDGNRDHHHDLLLARWGESIGVTHFAASAPSLVQHIGEESSLDNRHFRFDTFPGHAYSYPGRQRHILWVGDAVIPTGFARCTHAACDAFHAAGWRVHVIGVNHRGDPHPYPYEIYPCARSFSDDDGLGIERTHQLAKDLCPDVVVFLTDPWNIPDYARAVRAANPNTPLVGWLAVDGKNCRGKGLNVLDRALFWTQFGLDEAREGGFEGRAAIIPLGVDTAHYTPRDSARSREIIGVPEFARDHFIIGAVATNSPRKHLDLTVRYYAEWVHRHSIPDTQLLIHAIPGARHAGWDLDQLGTYYDLAGRMLTSTPDMGRFLTEDRMPHVYSSFDLQLSTSQGEGWGLTTMEGMACGVPQIVPDWAALGEWARPAVRLVPCTGVHHTANTVNSMGGVADEEATVAALDLLYRDRDARDALVRAGHALVEDPAYRWPAIGAAVVEQVEAAMDDRTRADMDNCVRADQPAPEEIIAQ